MQVVAAILVYKNKILAFKRPFSNNKYLSLKYEFPGGKVKKNETCIRAIRREIKEELGINIKYFENFYETSFTYPEFTVNIKFYLSKVECLSFKLNAHTEYKLLDIIELRTLDWLEADYQVISHLEKHGYTCT